MFGSLDWVLGVTSLRAEMGKEKEKNQAWKRDVTAGGDGETKGKEKGGMARVGPLAEERVGVE